MARKETQLPMNFSDPAVKRMVKRYVDSAEGLYWFELRKCRDQRTLLQLAYYFVEHVTKVQQGIFEAWGERKSKLAIHDMMKVMFLSDPVVNLKTGKVVVPAVPGSTYDLDTKEMSEFMEKVEAWAKDYLGVIIDPPKKWYLDKNTGEIMRMTAYEAEERGRSRKREAA